VLENREPQLGVVESIQGSKIRLFIGFSAKSKVVAKRHLACLSPLPSGDDPPKGLGAFPWQLSEEKLRHATPSRREWGSAWVLLSELNETIDLAGFVDLFGSGQQPCQRAACWLALQANQWMFRFKQGQVEARSWVEIKRLRQDQRRQAREAAARRVGLQLMQNKGEIPTANLTEPLPLWIEQMKALASGEIQLNDLDEGCRTVLKQSGLEHDPIALHRQLVTLGQLDAHQLPSMRSSRWSTGFSAAQEEEAERLIATWESELPGDENRLDLSHLPCVTIDDAETRDIDDALGLERFDDGRQRIWIHIADPARLIGPGSLLDQEAAARGSSLYLAQGNQPMFPECLSSGPMSLRAGRRSAAWSTWVELEDDGAIAAYGITRSWVKPLYKLSYDDADELIDLAPPEEADLADLDQLLQRRKRWREAQGALVMDLPEGRIRCRDGEACVEIIEPSASRLMVAEAMILAGAATAQFGIDRSLPLPYRSQLPAELPPAAELAALPDGAVRFAAIKRCLSRGLMGTQPAPHFSLGLPAYVQATSPIRRYGDLMVQRQIQAVLEGREPLSEEGLQEQVNQVDLSIREGISISREDQRHWQQVWFEQQSNTTWEVDFLRWLRPQDGLGLVRIEALALDVAAECPSGCMPGDSLTLQVLSVDAINDQLKLSAQ